MTIVMKTTSGPSSYSSGGFTVTIGELEKISKAIVVPNTNIEANDKVRQIRWTISGNTVTIVVREIDVTGSSPVSWSEVADGTDLSDITFTIIAEGY